MSKKIISLITVIFQIFLLAFCVSASSAELPITKSQTKLAFSVKLGSSYKNSPTPPAIYKNFIYVISGNKIFKLDRFSGGTLKSASLCESSGYSLVPVLVSGSNLFAVLTDGTIQCLDSDTLKSKWIYKDKLSGQPLSPIVCDKNNIYTGFWNGETDEANFVCLSQNDENKKKTNEKKKAKWTYKRKGGFYNVGGQITDKYVILGSDNGKSDYTSSSYILVLNKKTGSLANRKKVQGDLRSPISYGDELKTYFISSKAGYIYSFKVNKNSGNISSVKSYKARGNVTSSPAYYEKRLYLGVQNGQGGYITVLNAESMKEIYSVETEGYPQGEKAIYNELQSKKGKIYVYFTCNCKDGKLYTLEDDLNKNKGKIKVLYTPEKSKREYSLSPVIVSSDGYLYYKNDSGNIFALCKSSGFFKSLFK